MNTEKVILSSLVTNDEYARKVIPFHDTTYFHTKSEQIVFKLIEDHVAKYNAFPTKSPIVLPSCGSGYVGGSGSMSTVRTVRSTGASRKTLMVFFKCEDVPFPICTLTCEKVVGIARGG